MANVTDSSSLLVVPSGWSDGVLGSLKPDDGSGDFTFSRGSDLSATRVNEDGYIEKGYENLLLQSNSFDLSPWGTLDSLTSGQIGYDGSNDAWLFEADASGTCRLLQNISVSGVQCISIYAKAGTTNHILLYAANTNSGRYFDLSGEGSIGSVWAFGPIHSQIDNIGNGWFRCSIVVQGSTSSYWIYATSNDGSTTVNEGDNIYIQDAMINQGLAAYPYIETTTTTAKAATISEDQPRIDYTSGNGAVLIEPSRTNLIIQSEYFGSGWQSNQTTITSNTHISPEGVLNATTIADTSTTDVQEIQYRFSPVAGASYAISLFVKKDTDTTRFPEFFLRNYNGGTEESIVVRLNTETGEKYERAKSGTSPISNVIDFSDDYWRLIITLTDSNTGNDQLRLYIRPAVASTIDGPNSNLVTGSIVCYGLQFEQGDKPTFYIPTYGTSSTRAKDTATLTKNVAATGTIFININADSAKTLTFLGGNVSVTQGVNKIALAYSPTALKISHNGSIVQNIARAFDTSSLTEIQLGHRNNFEQTTDSINQFLTLDSFLTDTELNELTA